MALAVRPKDEVVHGLAFILGFLLLQAARWEPAARWHLLGAGIHLLLGTRCLQLMLRSAAPSGRCWLPL
jgi:hypothetical protein